MFALSSKHLKFLFSKILSILDIFFSQISLDCVCSPKCSAIQALLLTKALSIGDQSEHNLLKHKNLPAAFCYGCIKVINDSNGEVPERILRKASSDDIKEFFLDS